MADHVILGYPFELAKRMLWRSHGQHAHIGQFAEPLIAFVHQFRHQPVGDIDRLITHQRRQFSRGRQVDRQAGLRKSLFQAAQNVSPNVLGNGIVPGDAQHRFGTAQVVLAAGLYLAGDLIEAPAIGENGLADGGQMQLVTAAFKQLNSQFILQRGQHGTHCGSAAVQLPGGCGNAAVPDHGQKDFYLGSLHGYLVAPDFPSLSDSRLRGDADNMAGNSQEVKMFTSLARENMALTLSAAGAGLFAVVGIGWGLWVDSLVILFDGAYSLISLALSLLSLYAARLVRRPATEDYPFGLGAVEPLVIAVKGLVIGLVCVLSMASAVVSLLQGGRAVSADMGMVFGAVNVVGCLAVWVYLRWSSFRNEEHTSELQSRPHLVCR